MSNILILWSLREGLHQTIIPTLHGFRTLETPWNPYPYPQKTLTLAEGQGIQELGLGSLREHPGVTPAHH